MGTVKTKIDLTPFCDAKSVRYELAEPFVFHGWKYATDGKILIRVPSRAKDTTGRKVPTGSWGVEKICERLSKAKKWHKLKRVAACKECKGKGESDGMDCDCRNEYAEPDFSGVKISKHYCYLISRLPGAEWAANDDTSILFRFTGGEGVLMGMVK